RRTRGAEADEFVDKFESRCPMSRIPRAQREDLSPEHQKIWDHINAVRSGGGGPYSMLLHSPAMAQHFAATEDYFRTESLLPDADREIIILTAAREVDAR